MTAESPQATQPVPVGPTDWLLGMRKPGSGLPPNAMRRYLLAALAVLVVGIAAAALLLDTRILAVAVVCGATALVTEIVFCRMRGKPLNGGGLVYGLMLALLLPVSVPLEMAAFGAFMATLFGKEVFGGTGCQIFAPALIGKGAMVFSYPAIIKGVGFSSVVSLPNPHLWAALAVVSVLAILLMAWVQPANLRIIVAALLAATCVAFPMQTFGKLPFESIVEMFLANSTLLTICLVACDSAISPRHDEAKWLYGLMIGTLTVLMACFSPYAEAAMSAVLVANLFAPTLDILAAVDGKEVKA
jgi:Na+-transporting NADH:ubiquinone oxidoreductase subunit B